MRSTIASKGSTWQIRASPARPMLGDYPGAAEIHADRLVGGLSADPFNCRVGGEGMTDDEPSEQAIV